MKFLIALALIAVVVARPGDFYDAKFDNINIDEIIENERLFKNYVDCMVGTGKCTSEGEDIKGLIPEGVQTACEKCSEKQKHLVAKFMIAVQKKKPDQWTILNEQHNAGGKYNDKLEEFLHKYQN